MLRNKMCVEFFRVALFTLRESLLKSFFHKLNSILKGHVAFFCITILSTLLVPINQYNRTIKCFSVLQLITVLFVVCHKKRLGFV